MKEKIKMLYKKDDKVAYENLLELENEVSESNELYNYFDDLVSIRYIVHMEGICMNVHMESHF